MSIWTDKNGRIHVGLMVGGKRVHRILPEGASARDAKLTEAELRKALERHNAPVIPGDPHMTEVMGLYLAHCKTLRSPETARYHALRIGPWLEKYKASDARQAAAHIVKDMTGHYQPATINRSLGALKKALHLAWEQGATEVNYSQHVKRLPENNQRDTHLNSAQVKAIAEHASDQVRAAIWIALLTGCRRGEVLKIQPADIGADTITIKAGNTKTLRTRVVPIIPALRPWLKWLPLQINAEGLKSGFRRAREAAGMPDVHFHDLRRSFGTILIQSGAPLHVVSKALGHSNTTVTESRYAYLQVNAVADAMKHAFK